MDARLREGMKRAGCLRVFFGIESGNDSVLGLMNKHITTAQAKRAVYAAKAAGLKVGAFFIVGYPGETDRTVLDTVRFASGLPLDYLSFTLPYPIPEHRCTNASKTKAWQLRIGRNRKITV